MSDYILSCCSTVDLSKSHLEGRDIRYICSNYELDGKNYRDDLGETIPLPEFYKAMENGADTKTSQINTDSYLTYFSSLLQEGKDILHISFSGGLSGSVNSAMIARDMLKDRFPDRKLVIIDSLAASSGYGLLVDKAADLRDAGMGLEDLAGWVEAHKLEVHHWFFSTDLTFYIKGGRVSRTAGFVAGILGICPLLHVDEAGHLIPMEKIRSKKRAKVVAVRKMQEYALGGADYAEKCFISHSNCYEDALDVARGVEEAFPQLKGKVRINDIGTVIGAHSGPGTVALFFWGTPRGSKQ